MQPTPPLPPNVHDPAPSPAWLTTEDPQRARERFARDVALDGRLDADAFAAAAAHYTHRWGAGELAAALRRAHQLAPLPADRARMLTDLTHGLAC